MHAKIIQLFAKEMLFRRCGECRGLIIPVQIDESGTGIYYCESCKKEISHLNYNYSFKMTMLDIHTDEVLSVTVYDQVAESFLGVSANELSRKMDANKDYWKMLESIAHGQFIEATTDPRNKYKLNSLSLMIPNDPKLVPMLDTIIAKGIRYHNSLKP